MQTKIIWVFGGSAAGKDTLISKLASNNLELRRHFQLENYHVAVLAESTRWIGQFTDDPVELKRKQFPVLLESHLRPSTAILIKGQDVDLEYMTLEKVMRKYPDAHHEIIFLSLPIDETFARCQKKPWWENGIDSKEQLQVWLNEQVEGLLRIKSIPIRAYKSSDNSYERVPFPPPEYCP
jgi:hypothetical protein